MATKQIDFVQQPPATHWVGDGFKVHGFIPSTQGMDWQEMDPFLLLDYNAKMPVAPGKPRGVGVHPHRGFSTVTFAYSGEVAHHDSNGDGGVIREGDVQWMTAAKGILHKEYYSQEWASEGGTFQMVQLWVNLPARAKMGAPSYQAITRAEMGKVELPAEGGVVEVVSGEYRGTVGPAHSTTPVHLFNVRLNEGGRAPFDFPAHYTTALIVVQGALEVEGVVVPTDHMLKFGREGETFEIVATAPDTIVLLMSGEPLREPIVGYGPFVMNTKAEIIQAFDDFNAGLFGELDD